MPLRPDVVERLLLSKRMLARLASHPVSEPDKFFIADQILLSHDAAEIALAAIADQLSKLPFTEKQYLMSYFDPLRSLHPDRDVTGKSYLSQLNRVRNDIKHHGLFPDPRGWARVGENVQECVFGWCREYLGVAMEDLDESVLVASEQVKRRYDSAKEALSNRAYKAVFEQLALALESLIRENLALGSIQAGRARPEDAIRLSGFGVHANDFLALQEFLPQVEGFSDADFTVRWKQSEYGHPGNWNEHIARFCLKTFLDVALKIQHAPWVPVAATFGMVYRYILTAVRDGVEVWEMRQGSGSLSGGIRFPGAVNRVAVRTLAAGETIEASRILPVKPLLVLDGQDEAPEPEIVKFVVSQIPAIMFGIETYVARKDVKISCVPQKNDVIRAHFGELPEIDWQPDPPE